MNLLRHLDGWLARRTRPARHLIHPVPVGHLHPDVVAAVLRRLERRQ